MFLILPGPGLHDYSRERFILLLHYVRHQRGGKERVAYGTYPRLLRVLCQFVWRERPGHTWMAADTHLVLWILDRQLGRRRGELLPHHPVLDADFDPLGDPQPPLPFDQGRPL